MFLALFGLSPELLKKIAKLLYYFEILKDAHRGDTYIDVFTHFNFYPRIKLRYLASRLTKTPKLNKC